MRELSDQVAGLLGGYPAMKRKIDLLHYELERAKAVSSSEFIVAMTFGRGSMEVHRPTGDVSDPTLRIAMNYESTAERLKSEAVKNIIIELEPLEETVSRLEYYVSRLDERQAMVIRLLYFQNLPLEEIATKVGVVVRTVRKIKDRAMKELTNMYDFTGRFNHQGPI